MTKDEALKLAFEAFQYVVTPSGGTRAYVWDSNEARLVADAYRALEKALAQSAQKPVIDKSAAIRIATSLGWSPQRTWVGLTNNDLQPIAEEYRILFGSWVHDFARAIEAKLKEKNT